MHADDAIPTGPLPRNVEPTLVQLQLWLDPRQERFSGTVRIEARVAAPARVVWMHGRDLDITRAEAVLGDGRRLPLEAEQVHDSGVLRLTAAEPLRAGALAFEFEYGAAFGTIDGAYRAQQAGRDYVITQMEPLGARKALPGFDEPSFKHPWEVTLQVPAADVAVANAPEVASEPQPDGSKRVRFARTEALPSYLVAFAVGPWEVGGCDAAHAEALQQRFGESLTSIEGGPRALAQNVEDIHLCAALKAAQSAPQRASVQ